MSGTADTRWQQSNTHSQTGQPSSRDRSSGTLNPQQQRLRQETSQQQSLSIHPGNAWSTVDRSRSAANLKPSGGRLMPILTGTASGVAEEHHVSVKDFNAIEIKEFLRRTYQDAISGADESSTVRPGQEVNVGLIQRQRQGKIKWSMGLEAKHNGEWARLLDPVAQTSQRS